LAGIGTEKSKGTKVFSLTGQVCNTGLISAPMGTLVRHIVEDMGGGVLDGGTVSERRQVIIVTHNANTAVL
jgi:bidirectional [NiFe] hydrogenase diaphorase subunit